MNVWKLHIISILQIFFYVFTAIPLRLFARARRDIDPRIRQLRPGSLIVANHQWFLDPFMVLAHLPFFSFLALLPIRFPVKHKFMRHKRWQWLRLVGAYDIGRTSRQKMMGLYRARQLLRRNVTIVLFPEGEVNRTGQLGELQRGIKFLMAENTTVMFVRLRGFHRRDLGLLWEPRSFVFTVVGTKQEIRPQDIRQILGAPSPEY